MDRQVVFKTSAFGGFEKKAVLDYIYKLNEESSAMHTQLREQVESLGVSRDMLGENLRQANERLILAQRELETLKQELSMERLRGVETSSMNEGLQNELTRQGEQLAELRDEIERTAHEKEQLADQNSVLQSRQAEVDHAVSSVGKLLLDSRSDADAMIAKARNEAESLLAEAREGVGLVATEAEAEAQEILSEARREADTLLAEAKSSAELLQMEAELAIEEAAGQFSFYADQAGRLQEAVAELLRDYNEKTEAISRILQASGVVFERSLQAEEAAPPVSPEMEGAGTAEPEPEDDFFRDAAEGI